MAKKIVIEPKEWERPENRLKYCALLEEGNILFFPTLPLDLPQDAIDFLLRQRQGNSAARKNIAYKPDQDKITNHNANDPAAAETLKEILKNYSHQVTRFLSQLLAPYANDWKLDFASFRPFQEKSRQLRTRARNDLLHVDAFPTRPLHGARILRFFTNINPTESRHWITSYGFADLAAKYAEEVTYPSQRSAFSRMCKLWLRSLGLKIPLRSPYDTFMLNMHNFLKENGQFQEKCLKDHWDFPPLSCWAVFTDQVSHAALAGQYALEQTVLIPQKSLLHPEKSPLAILERLSGKNLVDPYLRTW